MSIRFGLQNFQSIEKAKFTIEPGLTVFSGPNSSGKTSLMRALKALVENKPSSSEFIKYGTDYCVVALAIDGQPVVYWKREKDTSSYTIDGKPFLKAGKSKLHSLIPNYPLVFDTSGRLVNVHGEWDTIFPFGHSASELFRLFEDIFQISDSASVIKLIRDDELATRAKSKVASEDQAKVATKIMLIENLQSSPVLADLSAMKENVMRISSALEKTNQNLTVAVDLEMIAQCPLSKDASMQGKMNHLMGLGLIIKDSDTAKKIRTFLSLAPVKKDFAGLALVSPQVQQAGKDLETAQRLQKDLELVVDKKEFPTTPATIAKARTAEGDLNQAIACQRILAFPLEQESVGFSKPLYHETAKDLADYFSLHSELTKIDSETQLLAATRTNTIRALEQFKVCPLCKQELTESHHH